MPHFIIFVTKTELVNASLHYLRYEDGACKCLRKNLRCYSPVDSITNFRSSDNFRSRTIGRVNFATCSTTVFAPSSWITRVEDDHLSSFYLTTTICHVIQPLGRACGIPIKVNEHLRSGSRQ
jgi:hypothetical protein